MPHYCFKEVDKICCKKHIVRFDEVLLAAVRNLEQIYIPVKYDRIFLLKKLIKKKQPKHILSSRLYFYCVEKYEPTRYFYF